VSADWSPAPVPVPYADFSNPQSLNLYGFVGGNPASKADPDGHDGATAVFFTVLEYAGEMTLGGPVLLALAPGAVATAIVASHDPVANHPADDPPSAGNMMMDALNPPFVAAPPSTATSVQTGVPATTATTVQTSTPASTSSVGTATSSSTMADHTTGARGSTSDTHTKTRSGRSTTKDRQKPQFRKHKDFKKSKEQKDAQQKRQDEEQAKKDSWRKTDPQP
jgi:hypothetical protein